MTLLEETKSPQKGNKEDVYKGPQYTIKKGVIARLSFKFDSKDVSKRRGHLQQKILTNISVRKVKKLEIHGNVSKNISKRCQK